MKFMTISVLVLTAALHAGDANSLRQLTVEDAQKLAAGRGRRYRADFDLFVDVTLSSKESLGDDAKNDP